MKKFFTVVPLQPAGTLKKVHYNAHHNPLLAMKEETSFPIFHLMKNADWQPEEEGLLYALVMESGDGSQANRNVAYNLELLKAELQAMEKAHHFRCQIRELRLPKLETSAVQAQYFLQLMDIFQEEDELHCCITYGEKPLPIVLFAALSYATQARDGFRVMRICYGQMDHDSKQAFLYDVTPLFSMYSLANDALRFGLEQPDAYVRAALNLAIPEEGDDKG